MKPKHLLKLSLFLVCLVTLCGFVHFDDDIIKNIVAQLDKWSSDYPQEKVYLHTDKPYYAIGDDIWFKAYVTIGAKHQLSALSGILNVELINDKDSVKKALKLPLTSGVAWGDFKLTDSLAEGNYRIRAYTNWMRNAGDEYFFDKTIQIGNAISSAVFAKANYTYSTQGNQKKVNAAISYTDIDGKPYAGKQVSYEVQLEARSVAKGKGITDDHGNLELSFVNNMPGLLKSGRIITKVSLNPQQIIIKTLPVKSASDKVDVQFFPESGNLVNGVRSRVAFKAVGADGLGVDIKGTVIDNQNNEVAAINTKHLGMGTFGLMPEAGKTYSAKITYPDGTENTVNLPAAAERGFVLNIYNSDANDVTVKVAVSQPTLQDNLNSEITVVAQSGGNIVYVAKTKLESMVFSTKISRSRFPSGIVQFTLFSAKGDPLNERIVFIQNDDLLHLALNTAKTSYAPREKVKLNIEAKDKDSKPVVGSFSVAVIDESKVPVNESDESTILSNILLTSDIKGYIEKPNYYFTNVSEQTKADLDILMLTQGYRRFEWKQILANNFSPLAFQAEKSIDIAGHLKTPGGKPIPHGKVSLLTTKGGIFFMDTVTDEQGKFIFKNLVFADSIKFIIQARNAKDKKNVEIELDNITPQLVTKNKNSPDVEVNISSSMAAYLQNSKKQYDDFLKYGIVTKSTIMKEVSITDKKNQVLKNSNNLNGAGGADQVIKSDVLEACATLSQCLMGRINFVNFNNGQAFSTRSPSTPMLIVVDGMNMDPSFSIDDLSASDVASVEVLRTISYTAIYGSQGGGGVLVITTKRGDERGSYLRYAPGIITYSPLGYYKARQFYSPQYDDPKTNVKVADLRTTIFWKPNILTDKDGNASIEFFNADSKGTYRAVIEGIDGDGNIGRQVFRYKVE